MFDREKLLIGEKIDKLQNKHFLVLGLGGVGGYVVESLVRCGVEKITIVDYDTVDITNINRQIIAMHSTIGKKKTECFRERIKDINPNCKVWVLDIFYNEENKDIIFDSDIDIIIDCCDTLESKRIIIEEACKRNIYIFSSMGAGNKFHPEMFKITKLKKTSHDPLAKKLRYMLKDNPKALEIPVIYSEEESVKGLDKIGSISYVPSCAGLLITSYIINQILGGENEVS